MFSLLVVISVHRSGLLITDIYFLPLGLSKGCMLEMTPVRFSVIFVRLVYKQLQVVPV